MVISGNPAVIATSCAVDSDVIGHESSVIEAANSNVYVSKELSTVLEGSEDNSNMIYLSEHKGKLFPGDVIATILSGKGIVLPNNENMTPEIASIVNLLIDFVKKNPSVQLDQSVLTDNQIVLFTVKQQVQEDTH